MTRRISVATAQRRLAAVWAICAGLIFLLIFIQSSNGLYVRTDGLADTDKSTDMWRWFVPAVLPTLSLMIGVVVAQARKETKDTASLFAYRLSLCLSLIYMFVIASHLLPGMKDPLTRIRTSQEYLQPLQSLVGLALGAFFVSRDAK